MFRKLIVTAALMISVTGCTSSGNSEGENDPVENNEELTQEEQQQEKFDKDSKIDNDNKTLGAEESKDQNEGTAESQGTDNDGPSIEEATAEAEKAESQPTKAQPTQTQTMYVTAAALNVRNGASLKGDIVRKLSYGEAVAVTGFELGWAKIGEGEFVSRKYLSKSKPAKRVQPKPAAQPKPAVANDTDISEADAAQTEAVNADEPISSADDNQ